MKYFFEIPTTKLKNQRFCGIIKMVLYIILQHS